MPLHITPSQIALRLLLATVASLLLGLNRDEHGRPAGMRTTMLVTLAATLAMLQVNLLLPLDGKAHDNFNTLDLMRLPLGILSGIGFIGAGTILKKENTAIGVTTAATLWYATMLGLLFGGGQIYLGIAATLLAAIILIGLKPIETAIPRRHMGVITLILNNSGGPSEAEIRHVIESARCSVNGWSSEFDSPTHLAQVRVEISWHAPNRSDVYRPEGLDALRTMPGVMGFRWQR